MYIEELARRKFWEYCVYIDPLFFEARPFLKQVADAFQEIRDNYLRGVSIRVSVSMPPRAGKSYITSLFCSWWIGNFPTLSVMRNCGTSDLYKKFSYDVRAIIKDIKFQRIFKDVVLSDDKQNIKGWNTTKAKQVSYFGNGVHGNIIGFGANIAITDDLYTSIEDALNEKYRERVDQWKQSAHNSRMEKNCPEIFIGTRWSKNDEIGKAIDSGKIDVEVTVPAMYVDEDGQLKSFCEAVKSTEEYLKVKQETDVAIWDAEYMQEPGELKGMLFPADSLQYFSPFQIPADYKYLPVDTADDGGDDMSAPYCLLVGDKIYIPFVMYNTDGTDVTIPEIVELIMSEGINSCEIEGNGGWVMFGKQVRDKCQERDADTEIRVIKNTANKHSRILAAAAFIRNHFVFLAEPYWTDQYRRFMKVLTNYMRNGTSKKDDAPDSLAMAYTHFMRNFNDLW